MISAIDLLDAPLRSYPQLSIGFAAAVVGILFWWRGRRAERAIMQAGCSAIGDRANRAESLRPPTPLPTANCQTAEPLLSRATGTRPALPTRANSPTRDNPLLRVLIVDDVDANRSLLEMFLTRHGFTVDHAEGGKLAVELALRNQYDAVLMDLNMPEVDGFDATRLIRAAEPPGQRMLIIAVSACIAKEIRAECDAAGMDAYFSKPLELQKFSHMLVHLIEGHRRSRAESVQPLAPT
jgi:CheY-like chemotaxis protein